MDKCLNGDQIEERFFIRGRMEILNVLNDLIHRYEPVTVSFGNGAGHFVTRLLEARDKVLIFELAGADASELHLTQGAPCVFGARPDGILVQFSGEKVRRISWGGSEALSVLLPQCIARRQRQESLRIQIPAAAGLMVQLLNDTGNSLGDWPLHDLSIGGLGVNITDRTLLSAGTNIAHASLDLPGLGVVACQVRLRHASVLADVGNDAGGRIGLGFCELPVAMRAMIQRYIINIEHQRRSAITGNDAGGHNEA